MSDVVLRLENITKSFGAVQAVDRVSLEIATNEFFALLGPSGSGKTTILRIIAGLETPDTGAVTISGRDVTALPPYARGLGMVFQDFLLFPHRTVGENIVFPLRMQSASSAVCEEQLKWVTDLVHLKGLEDRYPHQLSGGQKQRVSLARGLVAKPSVLLLDEPLANLDRELRKEMEIEVRRYQVDLGIPFVYVTHNQEEALTMSDRMAVMNHGSFEQVGPNLELYDAPKTAFVATFVGSANRMRGTVSKIEGDFVRIDWSGAALIGARPNGASEGDRVDYFIKSERITVTPREQHRSTTAGLVEIHGVLRDIIFKGQYADYFVTLEDSNELVASAPPGTVNLVPHSEVTLTWRSQVADVFLTETL